jgi:hypothetical protein
MDDMHQPSDLEKGVARHFIHRRREQVPHQSGEARGAGYVLVQGILQWPHLNTKAETFADVQSTRR